MRLKFALCLMLFASPVWAANVTLVAPDNFTPLGATAGSPLFVTGGGGGGGSTVTQGNLPSSDASGTVTTGGTFQTLQTSNTSRKGCSIQNPTTANEPLYVHSNTATAATNNSFSLAPGTIFNCSVSGGTNVISDGISITATTSGHVFVASFQ